MSDERGTHADLSWDNDAMAALTLTKYEGLGNDFLVLVDLDQSVRFDGVTARALCDRHRGVGADGLLRIRAAEHRGAFHMDLLNADGSSAETSGNGMRCAVLAAFHHGLIGIEEIVVETVSGTSTAQLLTPTPTTRAEVRVGLGVARLQRAADYDLHNRQAFRVDVGNPHLVFIGKQPDDLDVRTIGPQLETTVAGGQNVEVATVASDRSTIVLETWERGAGYTLACGSGSCATAAAARLAGLIDDRVVVANPGGEVVVELSGALEAPHATLIGPASRIASLQISSADLLTMIDDARMSA